MKQRSKKEEAKLQEEIKKWKNLPRRDRRKKEKELQKEFHDKSITIKCGKNLRNQKHYLGQNVELC